MRRGVRHIIIATGLTLAVLASSCSTVKVLREDQRRLTKTKIEVTNDKKFATGDLYPYLKQTADTWNPFLYVYNWENGKGKGWDKFVHKLGKAPVIFDSTLVQSSADNLHDHLSYIGYYNSRVEASVDSSRYKKAKVKYNITLGKRYKIDKISYEVPSYNVEFYKDFYADTVNSSIRKGHYLSEQLLELESARGAAAIHNKGYYDFAKTYYVFEADTSSNPGHAHLDVIVNSHTRNESSDVVRDMYKYNIGRVSVSYPEDVKFRTKALKNLNVLRTGDLYSDTRISTQYERYNSIPYFNSVSMQLTPRAESRIVDCDIKLKKGKTQGFKVGLEASLSTTLLWGISPEVSYYHRNIFHGGEILNVSVNTNHQMMHKNPSIHSNEVNASASLTFPKFFPFPTRWFAGPDIPKTEVKFSYNFQNRPEYRRNIASASFGYLGKFRRHLYYQAYPISFNYVRLPRIEESFLQSLANTNMALLNSFSNHLDLGISSTIYYNSSSNASNPKDSYWYTRFKFDLAGNGMSLFNSFMDVRADGTHAIKDVPYSQYVKAEFEIGKTFVFGRNDGQAFAGRFLVGYGRGYGNSMTLPFEKRFYSGGANSVRGWVARTLGPGCSQMNTQWTIPNQTGDMKLEANIEYRFKIFWRFSGAAFVDAGNVWEVHPYYNGRPDAFSFKTLGDSIAAAWGAGLRVDFTYILLRLDFGMRFHDPANAENNHWLVPRQWVQHGNYAIHFGVGYPF